METPQFKKIFQPTLCRLVRSNGFLNLHWKVCRAYNLHVHGTKPRSYHTASKIILTRMSVQTLTIAGEQLELTLTYMTWETVGSDTCLISSAAAHPRRMGGCYAIGVG
jgi:multidrug transporter EmrE-like cation transporter